MVKCQRQERKELCAMGGMETFTPAFAAPGNSTPHLAYQIFLATAIALCFPPFWLEGAGLPPRRPRHILLK